MMCPPAHALPILPAHGAPRTRRAGLTLVEVVAVLVVMGLTAALVVPSLAPPRPGQATLEHVIEASRATAIARSQLLSLRVDREGAWVLAGTPGGAVVREGRLPHSPGRALALQFSPLGSCTPDGPPLPAWDAARCATTTGTPAPPGP